MDSEPIIHSKVALLFLTRKELNQAQFWQTILTPLLDRFTIYIHSKEPLENPFFKPFRIKEMIDTTYEIHVKAWQALIREAIKDKKNSRFICLTESCCPLYDLDLIYTHLLQENHPYMLYGPPWWPESEPRTITEIPKEHRWGNAEFITLNREHAEMIAHDEQVIEIAAQHVHDHESYPSILFSIKNCLQDFINRQVSYSVKNPDDPHRPLTFHEYDVKCQQMVLVAKEWKSLFLRKFAPNFPTEDLIKIQKTHLYPLVGKNKFVYSKLEKLYFLEEMAMANCTFFLSMLIENLHLLVGVELGTFCGVHVKDLMTKIPSLKLEGVDSYANRKQTQLENSEWNALHDMACEYTGLDILRINPLEAAEKVPSGSLDFVFINEAQCEESLFDLLSIWTPKVRSKGLVAGFSPLKSGELIPSEAIAYTSDKTLKLEHVNQLERGFWWFISL